MFLLVLVCSAAFLANSATKAVDVTPILTFPGNQTVIVLIDLHSDIHENGSCYNKNDQAQRMLDAATEVIFDRFRNDTSTGVDVYDTCGSYSRTRDLLRQLKGCPTSLKMKGMVIYAQPQIAQLVSAFAGTQDLSLTIISNAAAVLEEDGTQVLSLVSSRRVEATAELAMALSWKYYSVHYIGGGSSQIEMQDFISKAKMRKDCIRYSLTSGKTALTADYLSTLASELDGSGVIIFASGTSVGSIQEIIDTAASHKLPTIMVTDLPPEGIQTHTPDSLIIFISQHSSSQSIRQRLDDANLTITGNDSSSPSLSGSQLKFVSGLSDLVIGAEMTKNENDVPLTITLMKGDASRKIGSFNGSLEYVSSDVDTMKNIACQGFCAQCDECEATTTQVNNAFYKRGDLVIMGLFPIRSRDENAGTCGEYNTDYNADQYVYAFHYAVQTAKRRYPSLLKNVNLGYATLDTCSDPVMTSQSILAFETCTSRLSEKNGEQLALVPSLVTGYVTKDEESVTSAVSGVIKSLGKYAVSSSVQTTESSTTSGGIISTAPTQETVLPVLVEFLKQMQWTNMILITGKQEISDMFYNAISDAEICVAQNFVTTDKSTFKNVFVEMSSNVKKAIVLITDKETTGRFFEAVPPSLRTRSFVVVSALGDDLTNLPYGTMVFRLGMSGSRFDQFYHDIGYPDLGKTPWLKEFMELRAKCNLPGGRNSFTEDCSGSTTFSDISITKQAHGVVRSVDVLLHGLNGLYGTSCPSGVGLCREFKEALRTAARSGFSNFNYTDNDELVIYENGALKQALTIENNRIDKGFVKVGTWNNGRLTLDTSEMRTYTENLNSISEMRTFVCYRNCECANRQQSATSPQTTTPKAQIEKSDLIYWDSTSQFRGSDSIWVAVVLAVACFGAFVTLVLFFYIIFKLIAGAVVKRHVGMGLILLISVLLLYLAVIPFAFTPGTIVCGLQQLGPQVCYAFCFGCLLVKVMSLRDYKLVGLGGELSLVNQFLTCLFIIGIQIAISVHWWLAHGELVHSVQTDTGTQYACVLYKESFVKYHIYVMFLLALGLIYSFAVRKETKSTEDAKYILATVACCIVIHIAWILVMMLAGDMFAEPAIAIGMLVTATVLIFIMFIPKIHMLARMQYDVGAQEGGVGYSANSDFLYGRPYSIPGSVKTTSKTPRPLGGSNSGYNFDDTFGY